MGVLGIVTVHGVKAGFRLKEERRVVNDRGSIAGHYVHPYIVCFKAEFKKLAIPNDFEILDFSLVFIVQY